MSVRMSRKYVKSPLFEHPKTYIQNDEFVSTEFNRTVPTEGSDPPEIDPYLQYALQTNKSHTVVRNVICHDVPHNLLVFNATNTLVTDIISYHGGWISTDRQELLYGVDGTNTPIGGGHGHSIYAQNISGYMVIEKCIFGRSFGYAGHFYTAASSLNGFRINNNIFTKRFIFGGDGGPIPQNNQITNNIMHTDIYQLGYNADCDDLYINGNTLIVDTVGNGSGGAVNIQNVRRLTFTNNIVVTDQRAIQYFPSNQVSSTIVNNNTYYVGLSPNKANPFFYNGNHMNLSSWQSQTGFDLNSQVIDDVPGNSVKISVINLEKAHIVIQNWENLTTVEFPLTGLNLSPQTTYELVNVDNWLETIEFAGTDNLEIDMTSFTVGKPLWWSGFWMPTYFPKFGVFLLRVKQ